MRGVVLRNMPRKPRNRTDDPKRRGSVGSSQREPATDAGGMSAAAPIAERRPIAEENDHLLNQFIDIDQLLLSSASLEEQFDPFDDFSRTHSVSDTTTRRSARLFEIWCVPREPSHASTGVGDGG